MRIKPIAAKPLKGFGGASVLEVVSEYYADAFRAVYTVKSGGRVYALHAFQKKSKKGIATPQAEVEIIKRRLKQAEELHRVWRREAQEGDEES